MDQEALVDLTLEEGARLDNALRGRGMAIDAPIAAFDSDFREWVLLLGMPTYVSRRQTYEDISSIISELDMQISLDNILLVKSNDPGLAELRSLAVLQRRILTSDTPIVDVAGRSFTLPLLVHVNYEDYGRAVTGAVRYLLSDHNILVHEAMPGANLSADIERARTSYQADLALEVNGRVLLVEAKATRKALSMQQALSAFGVLSLYKSDTREDAVMLLVSMTGYGRAVESRFRDVADFVLATWTIGDDLEVLADALHRANVL